MTHPVHVTSVHEGKNLFKCTICMKGFSEHVKLERHILSFHSENRSDCEVCSAHFESDIKANLHAISLHEGKGMLKCTICNKTFFGSLNLKKHILALHRGPKWLCFILPKDGLIF